jgi:hypothetical protein
MNDENRAPYNGGLCYDLLMPALQSTFCFQAHVSLWTGGRGDIKGAWNMFREFIYIVYVFSRGTAYIRERCSHTGWTGQWVSEWLAEGDASRK